MVSKSYTIYEGVPGVEQCGKRQKTAVVEVEEWSGMGTSEQVEQSQEGVFPGDVSEHMKTKHMDL